MSVFARFVIVRKLVLNQEGLILICNLFFGTNIATLVRPLLNINFFLKSADSLAMSKQDLSTLARISRHKFASFGLLA